MISCICLNGRFLDIWIVLSGCIMDEGSEHVTALIEQFYSAADA